MSNLLVKNRWLVVLITPLLVSCAAASSPQQVTLEEDVSYGAGSFELADPRAGLEGLSSYAATLTVSFDGRRDRSPATWSKTYVMLASKDPAARQLTVEKTGDLADTGTIRIFEMNGFQDEKRGDGACTTRLASEGELLGDRWEPASFLGFVIGAEAAGSETVNEVAADHYTFDQRALGEDGITEAKGELWVATDGGYIVKYLLTRSGKADYFGEGIEGSLTIDYELTNGNKPATLELPEDCPQGNVQAPVLPDASDVLDSPGMLTYHTARSVKDAADFYAAELPKLGWIPQGEAVLLEDRAFASYEMGDQTLATLITADKTITMVKLLTQPAQK